MSGGIVYVYDEKGDFKNKYNPEMVELEKPTIEDGSTINNLLVNHYKYTASPIAKKILDDFRNNMRKFVKVMPIEYKRVLESKGPEAKLDLAEVSDG